MGLFDDILKKPQETTTSEPTGQGGTTSGTGGNPQTDDTSIIGTPAFLIQKTEEKSLFDMPTQETGTSTELVSEASPLVHAEEGSLAVLVNSDDTPHPAEATSQEAPEVVEIVGEALDPAQNPAPATEEVFRFSSETQENATNFFTSEYMEEKQEKKKEKILHPKEFIEKSLENIDSMIADIDTAHESKISEAEGYGKEKEHFAELETHAYEEASALDEEKSQALHVRELLEKELGGKKKEEDLFDFPAPLSTEEAQVHTEEQTDTPVLQEDAIISGSVETTLTNLAVQNTVTETIESKTEESPVIDQETESSIVSEAKKEEGKVDSIPSIV